MTSPEKNEKLLYTYIYRYICGHMYVYCRGERKRDKKKEERRKEMEINRILDTWRCFGKNPDLATRVLVDEAGATLLPSNPVRYVLALEKEGYLEDTRTLAIGTAMLYSIVFTMAYLFLYVAYGRLWF
jgi:hypothetical protein